MLHLDFEFQRGILFVRLKGEISKKTAFKINEYVVSVIKNYRILKLVFNFEKVKFIDFIGMLSLRSVDASIRKNKGKLYLCAVPDFLQHKLKSIRKFSFASEEDAIKLLEV